MLSSRQPRHLAVFCLLLVAGCSSPDRTIAPQVTGATWTCYGNAGKWHCVPGRHLPPPPGAVDIAPAPDTPAKSPAEATAAPPPVTATKTAPPAADEQPITAGDTVIQLVAVRHRPELAQYRRVYRQFHPHRYRRRVGATSWYVLLLGPFADTAAARSNLARLPTGADLPTPWVRRATHADSPLTDASADKR